MIKTINILLLALFMTGNAFAAVSSEKLEERAAFSLGLKKEDFTISNTKASGIRTEFLVTTKTEVEYNCYVTGGLGMVSDAVCTKIASSGDSKEKKTGDGEPVCNALLQAAGKC